MDYKQIIQLNTFKRAIPNRLYSAVDPSGVNRTWRGTSDGRLYLLPLSTPTTPLSIPITPSTGVQSVTGLDTDNTDPKNPIVQISVDGASITGLGTPGSPLVSSAGVPFITAVSDTTTIDLSITGTTLSADVKASSIGPTELASTTVSPGSYGSTTQVGTFTVDADGRLTTASNASIAFPTGYITTISDTVTVDLNVSFGVLTADVLLTSGYIGFGSSGNLTGSGSLTWEDTKKDFFAGSTISINLLNSLNAFYVAEGDAGFWYTGATSTGLLGHRGFGLDLKTNQIYTMGDALSGTGNGNYLEIDDTSNTVKISTLAGAGGTVVSDASGYLSTIPTTSGTVTSVSGTTPLASTGGTTPAISITGLTTIGSPNQIPGTNNAGTAWEYKTLSTSGTAVASDVGVTLSTANSLIINLPSASTTVRGVLTSTDWNTFNNKQSTISTGNLTDAGTDGIVITGGTGAVIGSGTSIAQHVADSTHNGYLSSTDWSTFNSKQATISVSTPITLTGASIGIVNQGTTSQVLHGNAAGNASFGAIVNADITNGTIDLTTKVTGVLPVANGGAVYCLCGGTTTTGATQLADATTYFFGSRIEPTQTRTATGATAIYFPIAGTIISARVTFSQNASSNESSTLNLRLNNTTDITLSSAVKNDAVVTTVIGTGLTQAVNATTDYVEFKLSTASWATNPTGVCTYWEILVKTT